MLHPLDVRLPIKPLVSTGDPSFVGHVVAPVWPVGRRAAAPADGHPPIRLRRMMCIEPLAGGPCSWCNHNSPLAAPPTTMAVVELEATEQ